MEQVITTERIPIKLWLDNIETGALEQAKNLANLPFSFKHIAVMPDAHQGYGMPIGGVMATKGVIIPNAVGVDIGCGCCAMRTTETYIDLGDLRQLIEEIRKQIPVGFNHHDQPQDRGLIPPVTVYGVVLREYDNALKSLGTLGGGNHFIEIQKGSDGYIWVMVHSGSRNLGFKIAQYYNKLAVSLNEKWHSQVPKEWGLAFLPLDTDEAQIYLKEMNYAIKYALANRKLMMDRITSLLPENGELINIAHNYARMENHFSQNVMIHRKGATSAREGQLGIIPGSQGTKSYIVKGRGDVQSFQSCSHGAGRTMGRKQAKRELDLETEIKRLDDQGILHSIKEIKDLDEASSAYKPIEVVMSNQEDLIEIVVELSPLAVVKG